MPTHTIAQMKQAHRVVAELPFEVIRLERGYANRYLRIDVTKNEISIRPVTQQMKDLWVGGKGFDLWLMFQEITKASKWDSPENPICMSPGPLGGTTSFPGSGKTLVTSISPSTHSVMDCNVGGFFGPYFKFAGFDAIVIVGQASEETVIVLDAARGRITIERSPLESIDAHLIAEELTEMYADDDIDKKNISVVCAGRAAAYARMGVLNFSFYDWRKKTARIKQAGRGGIGTVFRHKKLKALVVKNRGINPAWSVAESPVARFVTPKTISEVKDAEGLAAIRAIIERHGGNAENVMGMLQDIQQRFGHLPRTALDEITRVTYTPSAYLYHIATFLDGFTLEKRGATEIRVCTGAACHVLGSGEVLAAFEKALGVKTGETTSDRHYTLLASPCLGACSAGPLVAFGDEYHGNVRAADAAALLAAHRAGKAAAGAGKAATPAGGPRRLTPEEMELVTAEQAASFARSRGLLAICTGKRTPAGTASKAAATGTTADPAAGAATSPEEGGAGAGKLKFLAGSIRKPGPAQIPAGATLRDIIDKLGGGMAEGRSLKAVQIGGPSGPFLTSQALDQPVDFAALTPTGSMTGPDRMVVIDERTCMVDVACHTAAYLLTQSCGKCTPCREGLHAVTRTLERILAGQGCPDDLAFLDEACATMHETSFCAFGVWASNPISSAIRSFRTEFEGHIRGGKCGADPTGR
jgi:NADH:ubiquinone oxidoreductase subunit E